jgi:hypothetical protein
MSWLGDEWIDETGCRHTPATITHWRPRPAPPSQESTVMKKNGTLYPNWTTDEAEPEPTNERER